MPLGAQIASENDSYHLANPYSRKEKRTDQRRKIRRRYETDRSFYFANCSQASDPTQVKSDLRKHEDVFYSIHSPPMEEDWKEGGQEFTTYFNELTRAWALALESLGSGLLAR